MHTETHWADSLTVAPPLSVSQLGSTAIGVLTKEGVVLAVEKRITSPLLVGTTEHHQQSLLPRTPTSHHTPYAVHTSSPSCFPLHTVTHPTCAPQC